MSLSADGQWLQGMWVQSAAPGIWLYKMGETNAPPDILFEGDGLGARLSPDGQWVQFIRDGNIWVRRSAQNSPARQLTTQGASRGRWSESGDRIFYQNSNEIWVIEIPLRDGNLSPGIPRHYVTLPVGTLKIDWNVVSDGSRFLIVFQNAGTADAQRRAGLTSVNIVFNWFTELNELVPLDGE